VIVPAVLNVRLDDTAPPPDDQVPVPFIVMVWPVITPVPVQVKLPPTVILFEERVRVTPVATDKLPLIVVACDKARVEIAVQLILAHVFVASVKVLLPAILRVDPVKTIVPAV
jgi:hypothetical protein